MQRNRTVLLAGILLSLAAVMAAADVAGKWKGQIEGAEHETIFTLKVDGSDITGTMTGPESKDFPLKGTIKGDSISFTVDAEWQGSPIKLLLKGTVAGDEMKLDIANESGEWSSSFTAKRI
jgi:uncharacterized protein YhdP